MEKSKTKMYKKKNPKGQNDMRKKKKCVLKKLIKTE